MANQRAEENGLLTAAAAAAGIPEQEPLAQTGGPLLLGTAPLGFPWQTLDPFLFCVHHDDRYPRGNAQLGPDASLAGRPLGEDFQGRDGWRMYHGETVPGFPAHPHRGFETVTIVRHGHVDHADSLGATARYGGGDVQWLTAGAGIQHSEMFPLLRADSENPLDLFQIWLNLPKASKFSPPHFTMFWADRIPHAYFQDANGLRTEVSVIAGALDSHAPLAPPPDSWAARADSDVAIWTIRMAPRASWNLPAAKPGTNRALYVFSGSGVRVGTVDVASGNVAQLRADAIAPLVAGDEGAQMLLLQGRPIGEPVVQYGPFVGNEPADIQRAMADYRRTEFGGWHWPDHAPVHARDAGRFAKHADGRVERPG